MDNRRAEMLRVRQEIIDAAGALFARLGYEGTTFSRVAREMGRPKSVIGYHLFPSKASLAEAVVSIESARWRLTVEALERAQVPRGVERLLSLVLTCARDVSRRPERAGAVRLRLDLPVLGIEPRDAFDWAGFTRTCLEQEPGLDGAPPAEVEATTELLLDATFGIVLCHATRQGRCTLDARLATLWTSLLQEAGVPGAAALVARVTASPLLLDIAAEVEELLRDTEPLPVHRPGGAPLSSGGARPSGRGTRA
ncbi:TetR/AcrR family transcriptional regulator [Clavibacter michiganensis]|nr:TetR/AcrR family transcriptional regulator [Clavibacter michiganensis]